MDEYRRAAGREVRRRPDAIRDLACFWRREQKLEALLKRVHGKSYSLSRTDISCVVDDGSRRGGFEITASAKLEGQLGLTGHNIQRVLREIQQEVDNTIRPRTPVRIGVFLFPNNTFDFRIWGEETYYLKRLAGVGAGSDQGGTVVKGYITLKELYEVARVLKSFEFHHCVDMSMKDLCVHLLRRCRTIGIEPVANDDDRARLVAQANSTREQEEIDSMKIQEEGTEPEAASS